jgi:hypothetical protein
MEKETLQSIDVAVRSSAEMLKKMVVNTERFIRNPTSRLFWDDNFPTVGENNFFCIINFFSC